MYNKFVGSLGFFVSGFMSVLTLFAATDGQAFPAVVFTLLGSAYGYVGYLNIFKEKK